MWRKCIVFYCNLPGTRLGYATVNVCNWEVNEHFQFKVSQLLCTNTMDTKRIGHPFQKWQSNCHWCRLLIADAADCCLHSKRYTNWARRSKARRPSATPVSRVTGCWLWGLVPGRLLATVAAESPIQTLSNCTMLMAQYIPWNIYDGIYIISSSSSFSSGPEHPIIYK